MLPWFGEHIHKSRFDLKDAFNILKKKQDKFVNEEVALFDCISKSTEYDIFNQRAIVNYIDYKWDKVGKRVHYIGFGNHFVYLLILAYYVNFAYY